MKFNDLRMVKLYTQQKLDIIIIISYYYHYHYYYFYLTHVLLLSLLFQISWPLIYFAYVSPMQYILPMFPPCMSQKPKT